MKIIAAMATMPGREKAVLKAVESLSKQCDMVHVYDNTKEKEDLADNGKFSFLRKYTEPVYYFSCDDDFIYPADYVQKTIQAIEKNKCIITYHGRKLLGKNLNYYKGHKGYTYAQNIMRDIQIDVAGTGVTAFSTGYFNPVDIWSSEHRKMSDVIFSLEAAMQEKKILLAKHRGNWIIHQKETGYSNSIHATENGRCQTQGLLCDQLWDVKYSKK